MNTFVERHVNIHNWPGQSSIALGILEDAVTNVFTLESSQQRTHSFVGTYVLNKNSIRGNLLRRPFDAISDIGIELPHGFASRLLQKKNLTLEYSSLGHSFKQKTFSRQFGESFLPLLQTSEDEIYLEIALLEKPDGFEFPKYLGSAIGYRWKPKNVAGPSVSQTLVASGTCEGRPFMFVFVTRSEGSKLELRMGGPSKATGECLSDDESSKDTSSKDNASTSSVHGLEEYKNPFVQESESETESITESVAKSIEGKLDRVQEGHSNLSELRTTLQYPKMIKRQCAEKERIALVSTLEPKEDTILEPRKSFMLEEIQTLSESKAPFMLEEIQTLSESKVPKDTENDRH